MSKKNRQYRTIADDLAEQLKEEKESIRVTDLEKATVEEIPIEEQTIDNILVPETLLNEKLKRELLTPQERKTLHELYLLTNGTLQWILKRDLDSDNLEELRVRYSYGSHQFSIPMLRFTKGTLFEGLETGKMYMVDELGIVRG